ncbi:MAG: formylglycine-generating enzyme family protein [Spirochaetales bacterium]|jgi:formylglycine-generating enzyme|nr:formylglycine-generating enzyme family protein [Spirochaetales bacterium]
MSCCAPPDRGAGSPEIIPAPAVSIDSVKISRGSSASKDMVFLDGGRFLMGTDDTVGFPADGEGPVREVTISPFYVDKYAVSNARFKKFVDSTGYRTESEHFGWSFVFQSYVPQKLMNTEKVRAVQGLQWWLGVDGARWDRPEGPGSDIKSRMDHPVVHISWSDAAAFCQWARMRLPTEAEWEYAARGGLEQKRYVWGDDLTPADKHMCNIWQGEFPNTDTADDGFAGTCPVSSYESNGYGLYCVAGNVWEWCSDWFSPRHRWRSAGTNPAGPAAGSAKVMRGGSHLCHSSYCNRYRVAARTSNTPDSATTNLGFRCVRNAAHN